MDALPDLATLTDDDLDRLIRVTEEEEDAVSQRRRRLHVRIDERTAGFLAPPGRFP